MNAVRANATHGNRVLRELLDQLVSRDSLAVALFQPKTADDSLKEHTAIIDALAAGDPDMAEKCLRDHLQAVVSRLRPCTPSARRSLADMLNGL